MYSLDGKVINTGIILVGKYLEKLRRWEDNIKMDLREIYFWDSLGSE
jgi:hypothetical protein